MQTLINDLALILIVASVVTILFKRLKQPLVLGYIVAGFLAGPHMPYMPTVQDEQNIETWSQIGVIFMMFSLGLEFSFKKIFKMGFGPVFTALCIMGSMIGIGGAVAWLFGWSQMDRIFLGGMLAMSSTTIIYKAFDDLGMRQKKFTKGVMSVLILEDMLGILLMVILSTIAISNQFEGSELITSLFKLAFFLSLWFIVGMFIIPLFLKKNSSFINSETLMIVSIGLCFLLVILATEAGYSSAFGAFVMGSIMAETVEAERIEHVIGSLKDFFGAIFFVSVGMMVDPSILIQYWLPILVLVVSIVLGQAIFGSLSFIFSGQDLRGAIQSGFSMAQIGEFAFIIATLGTTLHVTDAFLYPVVVAVSIITTFLTPYMIRAAEPAYGFIESLLPHQVRNVINGGSKLSDKAKEKRGRSEGKNTGNIPLSWMVGGETGYSYVDPQSVYAAHGKVYVWSSLLKQLFIQTFAYAMLVMAVITFSFASMLPFCRSFFTHWPGNIICGVITLCVVSLFLRPIVVRKNHSEEAHFLYRQGKVHQYLFRFTILVRFIIASYAIYCILDYLSPYRWYWHILLSIVLLCFIIRNRMVKLYSIRMERIFRHNLSRRDRHSAQNDKSSYAHRLVGRDIHIASLTLPDDSAWGGKKLMELNFGREDGIIIVAIIRGDRRINIPDGSSMLYPRDVIEVVGDDESIEIFSKRMEAERTIISQDDRKLRITRLIIDADSPFLDKPIKESRIREILNSIIIGIEMEDETLSIPNPDQVLKQGDILWLVG
ncbi:MAG: cation:proton antiporter [Bacteroidaceae bacterium]|nr:cation:proton antiporter [Bacteroidaceae bacterium]